MSRNEKILTVILALAAFGLAAWLTARRLPQRSSPARPQSQSPSPPKPAILQPPPAADLTAARVQELVAQAAVRKFAPALGDPRVKYYRQDGSHAKLSADGRSWTVNALLQWNESRAAGGARGYAQGCSLHAEVDARTGEVRNLSRRQTALTTAAKARQLHGLPIPENVVGNVAITHDADTLEIVSISEDAFGGKPIAVPPGTRMKPAAPPAEVPPGPIEVF